MMKITIQKYQELYDIANMEFSESDKASLLIQCLMEMNEEQVKSLPPKKYKKICNEINDVFSKFSIDMEVKKPRKYVRIGWKIYRFNYDIAKAPMNTGRYIETATFVLDITKNIHKILATMASEMKMTWKGWKPKEVDSANHESIANDMLKLDFKIAYQACVFFCKLFKKSIKTFRTYFKTISVTPEMVQFYQQTLKSISDGYTTSNVWQSLKV
jgi:hypothetical protein